MNVLKTTLLLSVLSSNVGFAQSDSIVAKRIGDPKEGIDLKEIVVVAPVVAHSPNGSTYRMTEQMRQRASHALDVLNLLPSVSYSELDRSIKVGMESRVLLLVNGIRYPIDYIYSLPLGEIITIEVQNIPEPKYRSEGYKAVINIRVSRNSLGHYIYLGNFNMIAPTGNNGGRVVANEQPSAQYRLTAKNIDLFVRYGFADINWNYPISTSVRYFGAPTLTSKFVTAKDPNERYSNRSHSVSAGANYYLSEGHVLSLQYNSLSEKTSQKTAMSLLNPDGLLAYTEQSSEGSKTRDHNLALFYNGSIGETLQIEAKLGYNHTWMDMGNGYYRFNSLGMNTTTAFESQRNFLKGQLDLNYLISDRSSLNAGIVWTWWDTHNTESGGMMRKLREQRANVYALWDWAVRPTLQLRVGTHIEHIKTNGALDRRYWRLLPQMNLNYMPTSMISLMANYSTEMVYPMASQVVRPSYVLDAHTSFQSNTSLAPSLLHTLTLQAAIGEDLVFGARYEFDRDEIVEAYVGDASSGTIERSFVNARQKSLTLFAGYNLAITDNLTWKNILQYKHSQISHKELGRGLTNNFTIESDLRYQIPSWQMHAGLSYRRKLIREPRLQGWSDYDLDCWQLSLAKAFLSGNLGVSLNYIPPIHIGIRSGQITRVETSFYQMHREQSFRTYDHLLMLRLQFRLNTGKKSRQTRNEFDFEKEQYNKDRGLL